MSDDPLDTRSSASLRTLDCLSVLILALSIPVGLIVAALLLDVIL